jgi:hypothetical protein
MRRLSVVLLILILFIVPTVQAQTDQRCFAETNQCISGRIRAFWEQNGGLPVFGFPTGPQQDTVIEGKPFQAQTFERNRLELHPENQRPYDVLLGRLGVDRLAQQGQDWNTFPKADPGVPHYYAQTGHAIAPQFWGYRSSHGLEFDGKKGASEAESLALFGLPLSEPAMETNASGATVLTQWFERARFEAHPENQPPYDILLGLLGNELRDNAAGPPQPTQPPVPPTPKPLPPPTFNNCQADPNPGAAPNYPVQIIGIDKAAEVVRLKNVSNATVSLDGWHMCSITGNQEQQGIGGTLAPGETKDFANPSGPIWNNSSSDPGALYNQNGQLVSYYPD